MTGMGAPSLAETGRLPGIRWVLTSLAFVMLASALPLEDAAARKRSRPPQEPPAKLVAPLTIVVALRPQRLLVFDANGLVTTSPISSGRAGYRTPKGVFTILQKREQHYSNLYYDASMPNMQRLTWSGVALHAGHLPGYAVSHGCIRLPNRFSKYLFDITELGDRVIVTDNPVTPKPISHEALLKPLPAGDDEAEVQTASLAGSPAAESSAGTTDASPTAEAHIAAVSSPESPRTRASIARAVARELADLQATLDEYRAAERKINAELKQANLSLRAANLAMLAGERTLRKVSNQIATNQLEEDAKIDLVRAFMSRHASAGAGDVASNEAVPAETLLEPSMHERIASLGLTQSESDRLTALIARRRAVATRAREHRDAVLKRRIAARKVSVTASTALGQVRSTAARRKRPITVLLSRKTSTMYVRKGFEDLLEAPIEFKDPEAPIGTHLFTAVDYSDDGVNMTWHAVTAATQGQTGKRSGRGKAARNREKAGPASAMPAQTAANALNRVRIPQHLRDQLAEYVNPGSLIIISDEEKSAETSGHTDLIVEF